MKIPALIFAFALLSSCSATGNQKSNDTTETPNIKRVADFNADSAFRNIDFQVALGPRIPGTESHALCSEYIATEFARHGADTVIFQHGSMKRGDGEIMPITNILARFNVKAPRRILIAAHYDTRPWADEDHDAANHDKPVPGANDGGSGVGVMLELARLFGQQAPAVSVDFLAVDGEDSGISSGWGDNEETWCLGTQYWAAHLPYAGAEERPAYGIVLDMVGGDDAVFYREHISERLAPHINNKVWGTAARTEYADRFVNEVSGSLVDDHLFINRTGIPCIDIVECNNSITSSFPPTWHTTSDDMHSIDPATLKAVGQVVADVIYAEK